MLQFANVSRAISNLQVTGLDLKDKNKIPPEGNLRKPTVVPLPNYITEFKMERNSTGGGSSAQMTITYVLNYRLLYKPVGTDRSSLLVVFSPMVDMIGSFWDAILAIDTFTTNPDLTVDIVPNGISNMGVVLDPADNEYWGCDMGLLVTEFVN